MKGALAQRARFENTLRIASRSWSRPGGFKGLARFLRRLLHLAVLSARSLCAVYLARISKGGYFRARTNSSRSNAGRRVAMRLGIHTMEWEKGPRTRRRHGGTWHGPPHGLGLSCTTASIADVPVGEASDAAMLLALLPVLLPLPALPVLSLRSLFARGESIARGGSINNALV
jgi:hypothetical protein